MADAQREAFEAKMSKPPFEFYLGRFDKNEVWPGSYRHYHVECAWQAWQAALASKADVALDAQRLDALRANSWDVRCFDMPTGRVDADIGWLVYEHHVAEPCLREVALGYSDDPRKAIDAAMDAQRGEAE